MHIHLLFLKGCLRLFSELVLRFRAGGLQSAKAVCSQCSVALETELQCYNFLQLKMFTVYC